MHVHHLVMPLGPDQSLHKRGANRRGANRGGAKRQSAKTAHSSSIASTVDAGKLREASRAVTLCQLWQQNTARVSSAREGTLGRTMYHSVAITWLEPIFPGPDLGQTPHLRWTQ